DVEILQDLRRIREDVIEEKDEDVIHLGPARGNAIAEIRLAAAVAGHVLYQEHTLAFNDIALDLRVAPEALGLLAHVEHRQFEPIGHPGREGDTGSLS